MTNRLESEDRALSEKVLFLTDQHKLVLIRLVCKYVVKQNTINSDLVSEALEKLMQGKTPDEQMKASLQTYTDELDVIGWDIQDLVDKGKAMKSEYHIAFGMARAVNALMYAFDSDLSVAITESIYEAIHSVDDKTVIQNLIMDHIDDMRHENHYQSQLNGTGIDVNISREDFIESIRESREGRN